MEVTSGSGSGIPWGKRGKSGYEEVQSRKGDHVGTKLPQVGIQLSRKSEARCHTRHCQRYQVVQVSIGGSVDLQGVEANVV